MTAAPADHLRITRGQTDRGLTLSPPQVEDGAALWRLARDSRVLDLNSSYSYLLWCRDYAATSVVAREPDGSPAGFITGYLRPEQPHTLLVWQVAVDHGHRGRGVAAAMLDGLVARTGQELGVTGVETTITPGNTASERLFRSFAERHRAPVAREVLFDTEVFPEGDHQPEVLYRIGPIPGTDHGDRSDHGDRGGDARGGRSAAGHDHAAPVPASAARPAADR